MKGTHGHVNPRPDGGKTRCGGPRLCKTCAAELADALAHIAPELLDALRQLGETYGPLGVAVAAARLTSPAAVIRSLTYRNPGNQDTEQPPPPPPPPPAAAAAGVVLNISFSPGAGQPPGLEEQMRAAMLDRRMRP